MSDGRLGVGAALLIVALAPAVLAQSRPAEPVVKPPTPAATAPVPPRNPPEAVDAFHYALRKGDRAQALALLAADVLVFEQGRLERSRAEYAKSHLNEDMGFAAVTQRTVTRRATKQFGNEAWVLSVNRVRGQFNDQPVDLTIDETMILQRSGGRWRIVHIHWSFNDRGSTP